MLPSFIFPAPLPNLAQLAQPHKHVATASQSSDSGPTLPYDILCRIAYILLDDLDIRTIRSLQTLSKAVYRQITPILYTRLSLTSNTSTILALQPRHSDISTSLDEAVTQTIDAGLYFSSQLAHTTIRRLDALRHVRHLTLDTLPDISISRTFLSSVQSTSTLIFPRLKSVQLLPSVIDEIRTFSPESYDQPLHPFLFALSVTCRPVHLCLSFRLVPSEDWATWRELSTEGQYALRNRITALTSQWDLATMDIHDVVHQVIPTCSGCINNVHFAPHVIPSLPSGKTTTTTTTTTSTGYKFPTGQSATGIPGPQWNLRSWQISECIKHLFPSDNPSPPEDIIKGTKWNFCSVDNHILTKKERDDDDDTGVGWGEVEELVKTNVTVGLTQDLPARHGFKSEMVGDILGKIRYLEKYKQEEGRCVCCDRSSGSAPPVSQITLTKADRIMRSVEKALRKLPSSPVVEIADPYTVSLPISRRPDSTSILSLTRPA